MDVNSRLVICCCREDLRLGSRDRCVARDQNSHDTAQCFNTQGQRCNVQQNDVARTIAADDCTLYSSTCCNAFIRVDALVRLFAQFSADRFLNSRNTCGTADQQYLIQIRSIQLCITHSLTYRDHCLINKALCQFIELCTCQCCFQMQRSFRSAGDKRQGDLCLYHTGQILLSLFSCFLQSLQSHLIALQIDLVLSLEVFCQPVNDDIIEVIAAQMCITGCALYFEGTIIDIQDRYIECTAAQVINQDVHLFIFIFVQTECQSRCGRFVDDTDDIQTCDTAGVLCCLTLCVIEVCRDSNDSLFNLLTQVSFRIIFQICQDHCRDFLRCILFAFQCNRLIGTHKTLDRINCILVCDHLTLGSITDDSFTVLECDDRRCSTVAFRVCDDFDLTAIHNCNTAVCCT